MIKSSKNKRKKRHSNTSDSTPSPVCNKKAKQADFYNKFSILSSFNSEENNDTIIETSKNSENNINKTMETSKKTDETLSGILSQLKALTTSVNSLVTGQATINTKLDTLTERVNNIECVTKSQGQEIDQVKTELALYASTTENLKGKYTLNEQRLNTIEQSVATLPGFKTGIENPDNTVIIYGLDESSGEDVTNKVRDLLSAMGKDSNNLTETARLKSRVPGKPGIVKASFRSVADKVDILRSKKKLNITKYHQVFMRSSATHQERLNEINIKTILRICPWGKNYRVAGNGRLVLRDNQGTNARSFRQQQLPSLSQRHSTPPAVQMDIRQQQPPSLSQWLSTPPAVQMGLNEAAISMHSHFPPLSQNTYIPAATQMSSTDSHINLGQSPQLQSSQQLDYR